MKHLVQRLLGLVQSHSCREQWIRTENCGWTKKASVSSWKSVQMALKWREVADCSWRVKQQ